MASQTFKTHSLCVGGRQYSGIIKNAGINEPGGIVSAGKCSISIKKTIHCQ